MAGYCMERTKHQDGTIVHKQCCGSYDLASLLAEGMIYNIGEYDSPLHALNAVKEKSQDTVLCPSCCTGIKARVVIRKIVNQAQPVSR